MRPDTRAASTLDAYADAFQVQGRRRGFVLRLFKGNNVLPFGQGSSGHTLWQARDTPSLQVEVPDAETISPLDAEWASGDREQIR